MISFDDLQRTLKDALSALNSSGCRFHITGGLASSYYGEPRFTQDIDIVINIASEPELDKLVALLEGKFLIDRSVIKDAVLRHSMFQALHKDAIIKVDFHLGEAVPQELERSSTEEILSGIFAPIVSKEDAIISKLIWISKGSHKSRQDVIMMLRTGNVDTDRLAIVATKLGVMQILEELI